MGAASIAELSARIGGTMTPARRSVKRETTIALPWEVNANGENND